MCKGSIPQTFVQRMDLPPLSVSKPDLNFDFPTNSQNSKKPRNRMAPGLFRGSIPQTFVQRMDLPPLSVSKPDLNFDFPTNSQNSKKPRNRMAPGLFRSLSRTKHPSQDQHRIAKGKEAILFLHSYAVSFHGLFVTIESGHQHDQGAFRQVEVGDQASDSFLTRKTAVRSQYTAGSGAAGQKGILPFFFCGCRRFDLAGCLTHLFARSFLFIVPQPTIPDK